MGPCVAQTPPCRLDRLTSQARYVRGHFSRRAMHASGDSPWHSSAKHHILEACFFRMTPFRSMLLTLQSGLQSLTPRAQSVPAYAQVLRHSSIALARRTRITWWVVIIHRKPPEVRICRLRNQSVVGTRPPSTSTPHWPAWMARR